MKAFSSSIRKISSTDTLFDRFFMSSVVKLDIRELFLVFVVFWLFNIIQGFNSLVFFSERVNTKYFTLSCALSIVRLRHHYERMSTKYFWKWIKQPELVTDGIQELEAFQNGIAELMRLSIEFESYFSIYKQAALDFFQRIEYKNDVRAFFDWFDKSNEKVGLLRKEVSKMEKDFEREKQKI